MGQSHNSMNGKTCVVTGANRGIGRATALGLAKAGAKVVMICRDRRAGEEAAELIDGAVGRRAADLIIADLSSQESIRAGARAFKDRYDRMDVLVNNAAIVVPRYTPTVDGIETQFAVNHLAYFLLTHLLVEVLQASAPSRIVSVSSGAHYQGTIDFGDLNGRRKYGLLKAYSQSKLANVLFTRLLAKNLAGTGVTANALHPGVIATNLLGRALRLPAPLHGVLRLAFDSPEKGAQTSLYLATSPDVEGVTGRYFKNCNERSPSREAMDDDVARRLWQRSEEMTKVCSM